MYSYIILSTIQYMNIIMKSIFRTLIEFIDFIRQKSQNDDIEIIANEILDSLEEGRHLRNEQLLPISK